jgi:hypothetical protein
MTTEAGLAIDDLLVRFLVAAMFLLENRRFKVADK